MKIVPLAALVALAASAVALPTVASARDHGWNRHHRHYVHCHMEWRHHHRVRVCR